MMFRKVSIIGVGLIGGSIGLAVRKKKIAKQVVGIFRRRSSMNNAKRLQAIDEGTLNLKKGVQDADLIIVATPVDIVVKLIKECAKYAARKTIIIDVASVKAKIVKEADNVIKNKDMSFVGTHPMAGSEESGILVARADLFKNSVCIITPSKTTKAYALSKIKHFWEKLGARTEIMPASKHDIVAANISHLPHLLAYNLCSAVSLCDMHLSGPGFKDSTRIAKSNPQMWAEVFIQNKAAVIKARKIFDKNIKLLQSAMLRNDKNKLLKILNSAKKKRETIE